MKSERIVDIQAIFEHFTSLFLCGMWVQIFPDWMIRKGIPRAILEFIRPGIYRTRDLIWGEFYPFAVKKIKQHEENLGECTTTRPSKKSD